MFPTWKSWLDDLNSDCDEECRSRKANELRKKRKDLLLEINHLQYEAHKFYTWYSNAELNRARAKLEYHKVDFQLATLDGRLSVVEEIREEQHLERSIVNTIKSLSSRERTALLKELESQQEEGD